MLKISAVLNFGQLNHCFHLKFSWTFGPERTHFIWFPSRVIRFQLNDIRGPNLGNCLASQKNILIVCENYMTPNSIKITLKIDGYFGRQWYKRVQLNCLIHFLFQLKMPLFLLSLIAFPFCFFHQAINARRREIVWFHFYCLLISNHFCLEICKRQTVE